MTIQKAFPWLVEQLQQLQQEQEQSMSCHHHRPLLLDVWVSDMCVKDMEQQVDLFLQAAGKVVEESSSSSKSKSKTLKPSNPQAITEESLSTTTTTTTPIIGSGTFFVLTLKCVIGHSDATFDILVDQQIQEAQRPG